MTRLFTFLPRFMVFIALGLSLAAAEPAIAQSNPTASRIAPNAQKHSSQEEMNARIRAMWGDPHPYQHKTLTTAQQKALVRSMWGDPHPYQHKTLTPAQQKALVRSMWTGPLVPTAPVKGKPSLPAPHKPLSKP